MTPKLFSANLDLFIDQFIVKGVHHINSEFINSEFIYSEFINSEFINTEFINFEFMIQSNKSE